MCASVCVCASAWWCTSTVLEACAQVCVCAHKCASACGACVCARARSPLAGCVLLLLSVSQQVAGQPCPQPGPAAGSPTVRRVWPCPSGHSGRVVDARASVVTSSRGWSVCMQTRPCSRSGLRRPFIPPLAWRRLSGGPGLQRPPAVTAWPATVGAAVTGPHVSLFEPHRPLFSFTCRDLRPFTSLPAGSCVHIALRCRVRAPGPGPARPSLHDALVLLAGGGLCLHALEVLLACSRSWLCRWWPWDLSLRRTL